MLITILKMINPHHFALSFFASGSFLVGNTPPVQAHTCLDKARPIAAGTRVVQLNYV
jgi:hypothetical protein